MYKVIINYGGHIYESEHKTRKQAMRKYSAWYDHGLDMVGQVSSTIEIYHDDKCIFSDMF